MFIITFSQLAAQPNGVFVVREENQNLSRNFNLEIPVLRDTILCYDSMIIHQIGSFIAIESEITGQIKDTSFYAPVRYIFLELKKKQGQEYCVLSKEALPYCRFNFEAKDSLLTPFIWYYGGRNYAADFLPYQVQPEYKIGNDIFKKVFLNYSNGHDSISLAYTLKKQAQHLFHVSNHLESLFPDFAILDYYMSVVGTNFMERKIIEEVSNTLSHSQIEIFNKWKQNFTNESVHYIDLSKDDKLRTELNSKCKHSWDLKLE